MANPPEQIVIKQEKVDEQDQQLAVVPVAQEADSTVAVTNGVEPPVEIKQERDVTTPITTPSFAEGLPEGPPEPQVFGQQTPATGQQFQEGVPEEVHVKEEPLDEQPQKEQQTAKQPDTQQTINMLNAFSEQMAAVAVKKEPGLNDNEVQEIEDVPDGFFDDFMADDFMEGLNVIDEDDEEESKVTIQRRNKEKGQEKRKEKKVRNIKAEEGEKQRRDPEKTRRDIQRDKAKCAQDKQKKMIKERLSVVETGLVPPGMEMEVDLQVVQQNEEPKQDRRKRRSHSSDNNRSSRRRSNSPMPSRRHHSRSSAADGRRSPSPVRRFKRSPDSRISISSRRSHRKSPSPRRRGRRSRSRSRERYRSRSRSRSRSPRRRPKQKPFLEELAEKLNETRSSHVTPAAAVMNAAQQGMYPPTPAFYPMQPPAMQPPQPQFDCYDENYFLNGGAGGSGMVMMDGSGMMPGGVFMAPQPVPAPVPPPAQFLQPTAAAPQPISYGMMPQVAMEPVKTAASAKRAKTTPTPQQQAPAPALSKDELSKLLAEKKISLSEFLSLTAKNEARPISTFSWQEKMQVLSRIQEAIDYLSGSRLYEGRLKVRKIHEKPQSSNGDSPLTRNPTVILPFTSIDANQQANFATSFPQKLNNLLRFLDINLSFKVPPPSAPNAASSTTEKGKTSRRGTRKRGQGGSRMKDCMLQKMTQTDPINCEECEKRKEVRKVNVGIQCGTSITHNEATQFPDPNEEYPRRSSSSLASMTPAQLLRQVANRVSGVMDTREERFGMREARLDRDVRLREDRMMGGRSATPGYTNDIEMEEEGYLGRSAAQFFPRAAPSSSNIFPTSGVRGRMPAQMRPVPPQPPRFGGYTRF